MIALRAPQLGGHSAVTAAVLVACYALAARVRFEVGSGLAVPTQLVFVPMLLLAAPAAVPLLVVLGFALSTLPEHLHGDRHPRRLGTHVVSAAYAVGPVLVLWLAGRPEIALVATHASRSWPRLSWPSSRSTSPDGPRSGTRPVARRARSGRMAGRRRPHAPRPGDRGGRARAHRSPSRSGLPLVWLLAEFARQRSQSVDQALELSEAYRGTALLLGDVVAADDSYTGLHSRDVVSLVLAVCDELGVDGDARHKAELTALLHDVGKVEIPKEIIRKPGPLDAERAGADRDAHRDRPAHAEPGRRAPGGRRRARPLVPRALGRRAAIPTGSAGEGIPLVARIVCACDAWSAMTTDRSYRAALPHAAAVAELRRCAGTQFDPAVVAALIAVVGTARRRGARARGLTSADPPRCRG